MLKKSFYRIKIMGFYLLITILGVGIDQYTKYLAVTHLKEQRAIPLLEGVFELQYLENRGAAFGILQGQQIFFMLCVIAMSVFCLYFFLRVPLDRRYGVLRLIAAFVLAGAYGNLIDRVSKHYVVDFLYFSLIDFPIFNVADIYVTVSMFVLIFLILFYYKEEDLAGIFQHS